MELDQNTIEEVMLDVGDGHQLYIQVWGNPDATDWNIHFHGGPGSATRDKHKTIFDPTRHKVIFYHQRGAGRSTPYGSLDNNTTEHLVSDINKILDHFKVDKATFVGGSWGSALPLIYAVQYPDRVNRMVLRGIFTGTKREIDHIDAGGFRDFFPELWEEYQASVPDEFKDQPSNYHVPRILGDDEQAMRSSAMVYSSIEGSMLRLDDRRYAIDEETFDPTPMRIMAHYLSQTCFIEDEYVFKNAHKLTMSIELVQGRYDMVCPPYAAYRLHKLVPNSRLHWTLTGHSGSDRETWSVMRSLI